MLLQKLKSLFSAPQKDVDLLLLTVPNITQQAYLIGVTSIKAYLEKNDVSVKCIDPVTEQLEKLSEEEKNTAFWKSFNDDFDIDNKVIEESELADTLNYLYRDIEKYSPKILGFSAIHGNLCISLFIAEKVKEKFPDLKIAFGGPSAIKDKLDIQKEFVDYIVLGEGEKTTLELLQGKDNSTINGLSYRQDNKWFDTPARSVEKVLSNYPFADYSDYLNNSYFKKSYNEALPVSLSRGCPYICSFCSVNQYALAYRYFPVDLSIEYMKKVAYKLKFKYFSIDDSICNGNPVWLKKFCRKLIDEKIDIYWGGSFRLQKQMRNSDYFDLISESGCNSMILAVESGSHKVLKDMKKYHNVEGVYEIFEQIRRIKKVRKLYTLIQIIVGYPSETEEDFEKTLQFIRDNHDVIDEITSCSSFILGETDINKLFSDDQDYELQIQNTANWCSKYSSPAIRVDRMKRIETVFKEYNLPHNLYFVDQIERIPRDEWLEPSNYQVLSEASV